MNNLNNDMNNYAVLMSKLYGQSDAIKISALQILIASQLKGLEVNDLMLFLKKLQARELLSFDMLDREINEYENSSENIKQRVQDKLQYLSDVLQVSVSNSADMYAQLDEVISKAELIASQLKAYSNSIGESKKNINDVLLTLGRHEKQSINAVYNTVQHITQRTIESLDPDNAYKYLDNSVMKIGPLKKAAMFDATKDKHEQVKEYQAEGKMLRDFKVFYKQALKKEKGN